MYACYDKTITLANSCGSTLNRIVKMMFFSMAPIWSWLRRHPGHFTHIRPFARYEGKEYADFVNPFITNAVPTFNQRDAATRLLLWNTPSGPFAFCHSSPTASTGVLSVIWSPLSSIDAACNEDYTITFRSRNLKYVCNMAGTMEREVCCQNRSLSAKSERSRYCGCLFKGIPHLAKHIYFAADKIS